MGRACVIVLDAVGVGALPDAADYGDAGADTLGHVAEAVGGLRLPALEALGLGGVAPLRGLPPAPDAPAIVGRLGLRSPGKDTTTGHWELAGSVLERPFPTYPGGFPTALVEAFARATGRGVLGNVAASGTEIIERLGDEHVRTGAWIVYTSADSVFQVAAHVDVVPRAELEAACALARDLLAGPHAVGRVIARPFGGPSGAYRRVPGRRDYALPPPRPNHLTALRRAGLPVHGVGKIHDVFAGHDISTSTPAAGNADAVEATLGVLGREPAGLVLVNLVETDSVYGHRNDPAGFHACLRAFDARLPALRSALRPDDLLVLTSDHGCDPTTPSTDHTREHALLLATSPGWDGPRGRHDGWLSDVGATAYRWLTGRDPDPAVPGRAIPACAPST